MRASEWILKPFHKMGTKCDRCRCGAKVSAPTQAASSGGSRKKVWDSSECGAERSLWIHCLLFCSGHRDKLSSAAVPGFHCVYVYVYVYVNVYVCVCVFV